MSAREFIEISSPSGRSRLAVAPRAGCCGISFTHDGREWLFLPEPTAKFVKGGRTGGVPLLFPYANRLRRDSFDLLGRQVDVRKSGKPHRDAIGRPMHGFLLRWREWELSEAPGSLRARLEWGSHRRLFAAFPFPMALDISFEVADAPGGAVLEVSTTVESRDEPVPISFGWHPYLRLPAPRARCRLEAPPLSPVPLVDGVPECRGSEIVISSPVDESGPLGRRSFDHLYAGLRDGMRVSVAAATRSSSRAASRSARRPPAQVSVEFVRGARFLQIYSPRGADFICLEPMTAPTAALCDASLELPVIGPYARFEAIYRVVVAGARSA